MEKSFATGRLIFGKRITAFALVIMLAIGPAASPVAQTRLVDLELMLAVDISTSVDDHEFALQRQGYADAFRHPDVIRAIGNVGEHGVAVAMVHWAGRFQQGIAVDWMVLRDEASAFEFASRIESAPRSFAGLTAIGGAIRFSTQALNENVFSGRRRTIDISGDGTSDIENDRFQRDAAIAQGITINGLVIYSDDHDLGRLAALTLRDHYAHNVIGGQGAFLMSADDFTDFATAIRRKLIREIVGLYAAQDGESPKLPGNGPNQPESARLGEDFDMNQGTSVMMMRP